jgi:hypothetical protein
MVKRNTGYTTSTGAAIFSENGELYYREYNSQPWRVVPGGFKYYREMRSPSGRVIYESPDRVSRLKKRFNQAARKIQNAFRAHRSAKRSVTVNSAFHEAMLNFKNLVNSPRRTRNAVLGNFTHLNKWFYNRHAHISQANKTAWAKLSQRVARFQSEPNRRRAAAVKKIQNAWRAYKSPKASPYTLRRSLRKIPNTRLN